MPETKKTKAKRRAGASASSMPCWLRGTLLALPVTLLCGLALLLLGTALLMMTKDPDRYHAVLSLPLLYLTAFLGGFIATRMAERRSAVLCGLCEGLCLLVLFSLLALCLPRDWAANGAGYSRILLRLPLLVASLLGALAGAKKQARRRHRRH